MKTTSLVVARPAVTSKVKIAVMLSHLVLTQTSPSASATGKNQNHSYDVRKGNWSILTSGPESVNVVLLNRVRPDRSLTVRVVPACVLILTVPLGECSTTPPATVIVQREPEKTVMGNV